MSSSDPLMSHFIGDAAIVGAPDPLVSHTVSNSTSSENKALTDICEKNINGDLHVHEMDASAVESDIMHEDDEFEPDYGPFEDELPKNDAMYIRASTKRYNKGRKCPTCAGIFTNVSRHVLRTHLPWYVAAQTACWQCKIQFAQNSVLDAHIAECHQSDIKNTSIKFSEDKYERWVNLMNGLLDVVSKELECDTLQDLCNLADKICVYPKHSEPIFQGKDLKLTSFGGKGDTTPYGLSFSFGYAIKKNRHHFITSLFWTWSNKDYQISHLISNYCYPRNWPSSDLRSKIRQDNRIKLTFGIHPRIVEMENTSKLNEWISDLEWLLKANRVVAVGECGLDNSGRKWDVEKQIKFFEKQIVIAVKRDLPLVIHCRGDERTDEICLNTLVQLLPKHFNIQQ
ncbi:tatD [Mytilus edulis]|uniref:TatD n=1 Tax=Mytilus edulis TaxID=6550 RepID=A0A8S3RK67_MYTED|nr:tatD [Mytilus edulis]